LTTNGFDFRKFGHGWALVSGGRLLRPAPSRASRACRPCRLPATPAGNRSALV